VERPTHLDNPWADGTKWCLESVIDDPAAGELGYVALATDNVGTLFAARPLAGEVYALFDSADAPDGLPDKAQRIADGLTLPSGLAYHEASGSLFISGGAHLYRYRDMRVTTLVDDLPSGGGFWTGGITIGPDDRLYVATGAPCDACVPEDPERGAILSFALDGSDRRVVATGLRHPTDLAFVGDTLWTVDTARDDLYETADLDELNRVTPGTNFGWPFCIGADNRPDPLLGEAGRCAEAAPPALALPTHSSPLGLAAYRGDAFPWLEGTLLMALGGTSGRLELRGNGLTSVAFDSEGSPTGWDVLIPEPTGEGWSFTLEQLNYRTSGFWPRRPYDVAVSHQGWIYVSAGGGRVFALRPL
jgi:glucose/arabinose dehydrogenase